MDIDLTGRRALVTGSTAGIGYAIAKALAELGATVAVNGRTPERVRDAIAKLRKETDRNTFIAAPGDVAHAPGVERVRSGLPDVDILVNNTGIFEPKPFFAIPDEDWQRFFETNVMSGVRLSRVYTPGMVARGWGRVVFISSESGINIPQEMVHYGMTKTAQLAVSRGLAETVSGTGVTVNSVLPGPTLSDGVADFMAKMAEDKMAGGKMAGGKTAGESSGAAPDAADLDAMGRQFVADHRPSSLIGRLATVEEVASMVAYVCSPAASATSGAALRVDGGVVRSIV